MDADKAVQELSLIVLLMDPESESTAVGFGPQS
jgi:hypothetical protein